ncbi:hypothetical protein [Sphingomonas abietis]|uniref:Uncharacterized protein n=1 Tax=Sphingomonas abietis TaxID=3012344 RepID=A0ABY7NP98_9SPHN|nr:hypothetical protein [Sphingomonas abietis]WBO22291.1 hypothetical protein PBT88_19445 [Sphingomonas abietis]
MNALDREAGKLLKQALLEVKAERRAAGKLLHGWRNEAALRAIVRALETGAKQ